MVALELRVDGQKWDLEGRRRRRLWRHLIVPWPGQTRHPKGRVDVPERVTERHGRQQLADAIP